MDTKNKTAMYKFTDREKEDMKREIIAYCGRETVADKHGNKSAWRLWGRLMCLATFRPDSGERAHWRRQLALYNRLTRDDMPRFTCTAGAADDNKEV